MHFSNFILKFEAHFKAQRLENRRPSKSFSDRLRLPSTFAVPWFSRVRELLARACLETSRHVASRNLAGYVWCLAWPAVSSSRHYFSHCWVKCIGKLLIQYVPGLRSNNFSRVPHDCVECSQIPIGPQII